MVPWTPCMLEQQINTAIWVCMPLKEVQINTADDDDDQAAWLISQVTQTFVMQDTHPSNKP